ncbi:hypothetical protein [Desulfonauticus submarinus]
MKQLIIVLNSDAVNRYGIKFPVSVLEQGLNQTWLKGIPTCIGHDIHRPIAWTRPLGIYLEPSLASLIGIILIPETDEEHEWLYKNHLAYVEQLYSRQCEEHADRLHSLIKKHLHGNERCIFAECVSLVRKNLAKEVFSKLFNSADKDGLINFKDILKEFETIGPGVFKYKKDDLAIFAHPYFRKSLSRLNNFNKFFLQNFFSLDTKENLDLKIALDPDMIGLASTYKEPIELEYWWGPKFDDNIENIPPGVTVHASEDYQKIFYGILKTEFWWKEENGNKIFECEEVIETLSLGIGQDKYSCRYVHAIFEDSKGIFHFDGAVRIYTKEELEDRKGKNINKAGKHVKYFKLFRIDGELDINEWKTLVCNYFQGNPLPIEYFNGERQKDLEPALITQDKKENDIKYNFYPYSINQGMGVRIFISYHSLVEVDENVLRVLDTITVNGKTYNCVEDSVIELKKALQRLGDDLLIPDKIKIVAFEDLYLNLPIIRHNKKFMPNNLQTTIKAIKLLVEKLSERNTDYVISFTLSWPTESKEVRLSVIGHVRDVYRWINYCTDIPTSDDQIASWLESIRQWLEKNYTNVPQGDPPFEKLLKPTAGVLWINRIPISQEMEPKLYFSNENNALMFEFKIPSMMKQISEALQIGLLQVALAFFVNRSECSKCKRDYYKCFHSKFLDEDVIQIIKDAEPICIFWTDKKA